MYENIGTDWSKLVTYLDTTIDTSEIRRQNQYNVLDQGKEALKLWSKKHPADATIEKLKEALQAIGRNDIRDAVEKSDE